MGRPLSPRLSPTHSTSSDGSASLDAPGSGCGGGPSTRSFKASQAASIAAVVESAGAHCGLIPGLAEIMGGSSVGMLNTPYFKNGGSSPEAAHTRIMNANAGGGDGDNNRDALDPEPAASAGHPSLPSVEAVSTAAFRLINECPPFMTMSARDSAPQLKLEDLPHKMENSKQDKLATNSVRRRFIVRGGMKGHRMSRATHGATIGCYYYEVLVLGSEDGCVDSSHSGRGTKRSLESAEETGKETGKGYSVHEKMCKKQISNKNETSGHLRIGWSTRLADLQAPVGYNEHSYAIRTMMGSRIHKSRREDKWGGVSFGPGDVLGLAICLVDNRSSRLANAPTAQPSRVDASRRINSSAENNSERKENQAPSTSLTNHIRFFKNGHPMGEEGIAFDEINPGTYHPSISCYNNGAAQLNFGPHFIYPPKCCLLPDEIATNLRPVSELCEAPLLPDDVVEKVILGGTKEAKKIFSKRKDDKIVLAFKEFVKLEATARYDAYSRHLDLHRMEILALREERQLPTSDLVNYSQQRAWSSQKCSRNK